ncbi:uncharacterized protein F5891DRAFT_1198475 [Suillus fuscotomentosus]|uniref:CxC2-like cysteine cluster KDZ transposase-associated domain-containing protein n=1 Tax=Suillus fuscotomentosus TaxID=1912939 RepID=A0AAD4HDZ7_9AGAM|nr:uncharacterized protein F5891DRAFT_1198475 [Suillus fuscotomentosus]KAG1889704.1 hypothetical protein F5891DRAFT_1198475 [Suillus fuscotomentosus]
MAETRGHPSKKPHLVRHSLPTAGTSTSSHNIQRHRNFTVKPTGQINLRTTYLDATAATSTENPELELVINTQTNLKDPWNESHGDTGLLSDMVPHNVMVGNAQRRRTAGDNPIHLWLPERQTYPDKFIRLEGCGEANHSCHDCEDSNTIFCCDDCFSVNLYCQSCICRLHQNMPLHRLKMWHDEYFHPIMLKQLGLHIQLSHSTVQPCYNPKPAYDDDFTIIDVHGIHEVALDFCNSTSTNPRTAATFTVLERFHLLSFESKVSAFKFYHCIARRSDNTGVNPIKDRYSVFLRIMAEWHNIKALKCAGRGHDPAGVDATQEGELVVLCPACPHPGKNLAETLNDVVPRNRWIYSLFLAIDANFHLKHRLAYLQENGTLTQEKSTCISHNTVNMADTKASKGLAAMGVGTVVCARHDMRLANGVGDLQKGEKYLNMDYIVFSALSRFSSIPAINFSYDIACQWHKKLWH